MELDRSLLALATRDLRGPIALVGMVGLAVVACRAVQAIAVAQALVAVLRGDDLTGPLIIFGIAVIIRAGLIWLREVSTQWAGLAVKTRLRNRLIAHLGELGPSFTTGNRTGNLQAALVDGVEGLEAYYARYLPQLAVSLLGSAGILVYLLSLSPVTALAVGVFAALIPLAPRLWEDSLRGRVEAHWRAYRELKSDYVDGMQGMTTLKALGAAGRYRDGLHARAWHLFLSTMRQLAASLVGTGLTALMVGLGGAVTVVVAVTETAGGRLDVLGLLTVLLLAAECYRPFSELATYWHMAYVGFSAAGTVNRLLETSPLPAGRSTGLADSSVEFRQVTFGYRDTPVLRELNLSVAPGEKVALVGSSGAGKTTIISLLLRFYDPQQGSVRIGGVDLRELDPETLRREVALVPQDPYLFHGTILDNIRLGSPDASLEDVRRAAEIANAAEFIKRLPNGYHSRVDERGLTLSGGQRQRLAIARAVLRDAPILLLDEATSNLDAAGEALVAQALERLQQGRTTLMVTHRMTSARSADRIVVLRDGIVTESGSHEALYGSEGDYYRLTKIQEGVA